MFTRITCEMAQRAMPSLRMSRHQALAIVDGKWPAEIVPDLIARLNDILGQRPLFGGSEVFVELSHARRTENDDVGSGVMQEPIERQAHERPSGVAGDLT